MSTLQLELFRHKKMRANMTCQGWKKAVNRKDHEIIQMKELTNKDFKAATINLFKDLMETWSQWGISTVNKNSFKKRTK